LGAQRDAMKASEAKLSARIDELTKELADAQTRNAVAATTLKQTVDRITAKKWLMASGDDGAPWQGDVQSLRAQIDNVNNAQKKLAVELDGISKKLTPEKK